jgi:uncharacterized membrane protein
MEFSLEPRQHGGSERYWSGFAAGAFLGTGAALAALYFANLNSSRDRHILRLEDNIQIARPVDEVFSAWANLESLPDHLEFVNSVRVAGFTSYWDVTIDGKDLKWQAQTVQFIPNEAIAWKSVSGPKHSGRVNFSNIGDDTLMHVTMNYAPPLGRFGRMLAPVDDHLENYIAKALREFKHSLEGKASGRGSDPSRAPWRNEQQATGTYGRIKQSDPGLVGDPANTTEKRPEDVEYTRPPEAGYPTWKP